MATKSLVKERNGTWHEDFRFNKKPIRKSLGLPVKTGNTQLDKENKRLAEEIAAKHFHDLHSGASLNNYTHSWEHAAEEYIIYRREKYDIREQENPSAKHLVAKHRESMKDVVHKFEVVDRFLAGKDVNEVCQDDLKKIRRHLLEVRGVTHKTANRYLSQVRSTLIQCRDNLQNPDKTPWLTIVPSFPISGENDERLVDLPPSKFWELYNKLPALHQDMMVVAIATGIRAGVLKLMEKSWLFLDDEIPMVVVPAVFQKNREPFAAPLPEVAVQSFKRAISRHPHSVHAFNTERFGKPLSDVSTSGWYGALEAVGLKGKLTWHDLRHVFAANHVINGTPESVIQRLGGWKTPGMVKRYAHTNAHHLHGFTDSVNTYLTRSDSNSEANVA